MENQIRENQILEDQAMAMEAKTTAHKLLVADMYLTCTDRHVHEISIYDL